MKKKIIPALMTAIILLATLGGLTLFGVNLMTHAKDVPESFLKTIASAPAMFAYSFACLVSLLTPNVTIFSFSIVKFLTHLVSLFAVPVGLAVYGIFTIKAIKAKTSFVEWFFLLYLLAVTFWNVPDGIRYLLPISGLAGIFIIENFDNITRKIAALKTRTFSFPEMDLGSLFLFILLFFNIINIAQRFSFNDDEILKPPTTALVQKMQSVMKEGEVFTAVRARALCLLTGRPGVELRYPFDYFARDFNVVYFVKLKPRWALEKGWDEESVEKWYASILDFSPIWENESFIIFKIAAKKQSLGDLQD